MRIIFRKYGLKVTGVVVGGIVGFLYYYFIGCSSGSCPISSNPYISILYGSLLGYLVSEMFKKKKHETTND